MENASVLSLGTYNVVVLEDVNSGQIENFTEAFLCSPRPSIHPRQLPDESGQYWTQADMGIRVSKSQGEEAWF